jgi:hypothetical protein
MRLIFISLLSVAAFESSRSITGKISDSFLMFHTVPNSGLSPAQRTPVFTRIVATVARPRSRCLSRR